MARGFAVLGRGGVLVVYGNPLSFSSLVPLLTKLLVLNLWPNGKTDKVYGTTASRTTRSLVVQARAVTNSWSSEGGQPHHLTSVQIRQMTIPVGRVWVYCKGCGNDCVGGEVCRRLEDLSCHPYSYSPDVEEGNEEEDEAEEEYPYEEEHCVDTH